MKHTAQRALLVVTLGLVAIASSGCQAEGYEEFSRMLGEFIGGALGVLAILIVILTGLPPV